MLSQDQLDAFDTDGFLVLENVFDQHSVINPLVEEYEQLLRSLLTQWSEQNLIEPEAADLPFADGIRAAYAKGLDYFQPLDISLPPGKITVDMPFHAGPGIFNLMIDNNLLNIVEQFIGPEITSNPIQHVRIKPPTTELDSDEIRPHITSTSWHQDRAVTLEEADQTRMVTVWAAITDATVENGCLQVIPGSHRGDMLEHCPSPQLSIPDTLFNVADARPLPVKSGGVVIFHPLTVHGSLENTTDDIRWSFDLRYNVTGDPTGRAFFPEFVARSKAHPDTECRSASDWNNSWIAARERLSLQDSVEIHRWDGQSVICA